MRIEDVTEANERANRLVAAWILREFRSDGDDAHLRACPEAAVAEGEAFDSQYGCDTGCEYARWEAVITCPHGVRAEFEYGEFGELAYIIEELEKDDDRERAGSA